LLRIHDWLARKPQIHSFPFVTFSQPDIFNPPTALFGSYPNTPDVFDEVIDPTGAVRPHWSAFITKVNGLGADALRERQQHAQQLLRDHGVTYNVHADGSSDERPWRLDMMPLVIAPDEWQRLEKGLIQRTILLNRILQDLYGPQNLLHDGLLPPAIIHANAGFLRPCHGISPPGGRFLTLHAVDLTRAPNGEWWVMSDRTQSPSGVGYTLENRIILARVMAEEFRSLNVERLASFFLARKAGLRAMAPWTKTPNIVLLTPGPYAATFFEHAYLARYLGYPLVEGSDLTVRDRKVFLKTIHGLQRVDVIIRRVDDTFCDPLELRSNSFLGVTGLVEATRAGNVAISNALGSGAVEAPALLAFLPALSRHLLGEKLSIPNVATWWCGQERERDYAFKNLQSLVLKRAFVGGGDPVFCETMNAEGLRVLRAQIEANPHQYVGQERVALSTAPIWNGERLEPRPLILRCFVTATENGYAVMPGGLTRISPTALSPVVSSRFGGGNKDTWVIASQPSEVITLLDSRGLPPEMPRAQTVPSRVAENFFWLGRHIERLEDTTRLLRPVLGRLTGEGSATAEAELAAMVQCLIVRGKLPSEPEAPNLNHADLIAALRDPVFQQTLPELIQRIDFLNASLRDRFSGDTWRILHQLETSFPTVSDRASPETMLTILHRLIFQIAAFIGMEMENTTRGDAWRFMEAGRRIERANNLASTVLSVVQNFPSHPAALVPLLEYSDSIMTYRGNYFAQPDLPRTLGLLMRDSSNPRSLMFQLISLEKHLLHLPGLHAQQPEYLKISTLLDTVKSGDHLQIYGDAPIYQCALLEKLLFEIIDGCRSLSDMLTVRYFNHLETRAS